MSSPNDEHDDGGHGRSYRDVGPADPPPVTDAMVNPRSAPPSDALGGPLCHVCGEQNRPRSTYCLQCGSRLRGGDNEPVVSHDPASDLVGEVADEGFWDPDMDDKPWERDDRPAAGSVRDERPEVYVTDETETVDVPSRDSRQTVRLAVWGVLILAAVSILFMTFLGGDGGESDTPTTSLVATVDAQVYGSLITELSGDVAGLQEQAGLINQRWEAGEADYQETLAALENLADDVSSLASRIRVEEPPADLSLENHTRLVTSAGTLEAAAMGMVEGLKAPDTGQERRAALARFSASAAEFGAVSDTLLQVIDLTAPDSTEG